ncbi:2-succinyl-5-enolpyruvyl-6-hydroxy-3-cyclohexene-1-carboxylic-acid synthase [Oscillatoria acuminata]|uniref:2-succinyl-5-enolpyruvyl-6-hydroxy-3-cyclohexene-1-carboxylate synthase n=1 Tax=Oscillatoria acuminata PCC 6304 TaxID=56110 RepID=K9TFA9_9CYAN|nr:2-succinyl-5-enolpyruvyl-6-hydroxy-3-cyclohexene-1-carboxylic-acid synthase [Oscillatoria acuminata]AFY81562.1 2-succinyl-5-enolpyruvyl-6-hydroxy-3-cyclohexene-1-carboxylate synthase [Oscillatoria acuminata PCC 6304]
MPIDFRNTNTVWASILVETFQRLGLTTAVICPGSRSTPLTVAFASHPQIEAIPILDERSASFFALGQAKQTGKPVVLVCTSGTAGANFYPAIIETKESRVPLLILTADRPPELRDCHSGQTIDQIKLYGHYPNWQTELATPSLEIKQLRYLRQTLIHAWEKTLFPVPGPVHLNLPFRDPLAPLPQPEAAQLAATFQLEKFFTHLPPSPPSPPSSPSPPSPLQDWQNCQRGIIIAGIAQPQNPRDYCQAIAYLSKTLNWPVLAEGLSPLRNYADLNPYLISTYDFILRNPINADKLTPEIAIQIGELPTSKTLRSWLETTQPLTFLVTESDRNLDPLHGRTIPIRMAVTSLAASLNPIQANPSPTAYLQHWGDAEHQIRKQIDTTLSSIPDLIEPKVAWLISQNLPPATPLFIANSMPVRDIEYFWKPGNSHIRPFVNRGANGIDGTLSTALGIAHRHQSSVMLTGDLALLHDTNGFLIRQYFQGHLTIILINNNGGGIFGMLPIAKFDPPFTEFFATPQNINFARLCAGYDIEHQRIESWQQLQSLLNPLPSSGIRVLEVKSDRHLDVKWRQDQFQQFAADEFQSGTS